MRVRLKLDRLLEQVAKGSLSQNHWAIRLGISRGHWSQILNGKYPFPSPKTRERLVEVFELPFDELFDIEAGPGGADANFQAALADRYIIDREVGQGGMGTVYRARDVKHNRTVALKIISPEAVSGIGAQQFLSEIRHTARLQHHHILPLYDSGEAAGYPFYVVPFFEHGSLRDLIRDSGPLSIDEARRVAEGIAQALQYAHDHQVLHCDVKPENVLVSRHRQAVHSYVADFGISRVVHAEFFEWGKRGEIDSSAGTPAYVSPEQASGDDNLLPPSDLYSLACTVFEMLAGRPPFRGTNSVETVAQRFAVPPPDVRKFAPHVPAAVSRILQRAMAVDPTDRHRSVDDFMRVLDTAIASPRSAVLEGIGHAATRAATAITRKVGLKPSLRRRTFMDRFRQDVRYAVRSLLRQPAFAAVVMVTLALGIGMNTAVFSILYGTVLRPLPFDAPNELIRIGRTQPTLPGVLLPISPPNYLDFRERITSFESIEVETGQGFMLTDESGAAERVSARAVSTGFLGMLGRQPQAGRLFVEQDGLEGADRVMILSHDYWTDRWAGDSSVLGSTILLTEEPVTVIGIMPPGFRYGTEQIWVPFQWTAQQRTQGRGNNSIRVHGRIRPNVALPAAIAELDQAWRQLGSEYPGAYDESGMSAQTLPEVFVENTRRQLFLLAGAAGLVLLVACANVANLMLARSEARQREVAVRAALGAARGRLVRQFLTESVLLAGTGGLLGIGAAYASVAVIMRIFGASIPRSDDVAINTAVLGFAVGISLLTGLLVGLIPALQGRPDYAALKEGGRSGARRMTWLRKGLVITEVALALVLVTGAGLLIKSFWRAMNAEIGIDDEHVLVANYWLPDSRYQDAMSQVAFVTELETALRAHPRIREVGSINLVPIRQFGNNVTVLNVQGNPEAEASFVEQRWITPSYFGSMGIPIVRGRGFTEADLSIDTRPTTTIINERLAALLFPNGKVLGERLARFDGLEIIGIAGDVKTFGPDRDVRPVFYQPTPAASNLVVRTDGAPLDIVADLRRIFSQLDPAVSVFRVEAMDDIISGSLGDRRFQFSLLGIFAGVALVLGAVGIYGVMSYTVEQQTRELGVRLALGASAQEVLRQVLARGATLAAVGIVIGAGGAYGASRLAGNMLFEVNAFDPVTYGLVASILAGVALFACYAPARRAAAVDPMEALRYE